MNNDLRKFLRKYPLLHLAGRKIYRFIINSPEPFLQARIQETFKNYPEVFFIQVGSNDGITGDPIHNLIVENKNYSGIFIEPVDFCFKRLQENYKNVYNSKNRLIFENLAIGLTADRKKIYYLPEDARQKSFSELPNTYDQLGSFNINHIIKHLGEQIIPYIVETEVDCCPLQAVLDKHNVGRIDLVHIDVEGFDFQVLSQIDLEKYKPKLILYEHTHLTESEKEQADSWLGRYDYSVYKYRGDTLAIFNKSSAN